MLRSNVRTRKASLSRWPEIYITLIRIISGLKYSTPDQQRLDQKILSQDRQSQPRLTRSNLKGWLERNFLRVAKTSSLRRIFSILKGNTSIKFEDENKEPVRDREGKKSIVNHLMEKHHYPKFIPKEKIVHLRMQKDYISNAKSVYNCQSSTHTR